MSTIENIKKPSLDLSSDEYISHVNHINANKSLTSHCNNANPVPNEPITPL